MAAATAVFNTFELLEIITIHLPIADILAVSRVCKKGRSVLEKSLEIRRILFDSELPGREVCVNGTPVNNDGRDSYWIFRTGPLRTPLGAPEGQLLVFNTPTTRSIIFCPRELSMNIICHGIHLSATPDKQERAFSARSWTVHWTAGDGTSLGSHTLKNTLLVHENVFLAYVTTFHRIGGIIEQGIPVWRGSTRIFAASVAVQWWGQLMTKREADEMHRFRFQRGDVAWLWAASCLSFRQRLDLRRYLERRQLAKPRDTPL